MHSGNPRGAFPVKDPFLNPKSEQSAPTQRTHDPLRKLFSRMIFRNLDETSCMTDFLGLSNILYDDNDYTNDYHDLRSYIS